MITYHNGDILKSGADYICHQVNCRGVMGAGLVLQLRKAYPQLYEDYRKLCNILGPNLLGKTSVYVDYNLKSKNYLATRIVNMFAQDGYGRNKVCTNYEAFESCVRDVIKVADRNNYDIFYNPVIAIPYKIGCGLAGGDWNIIENIIRKNDKDWLDIQVWKLEN